MTMSVAPGVASAQRQGMRAAPFQMPDVYSNNLLTAELMLGTVDGSPFDDFTVFALELGGSFSISPKLHLTGLLPIASTTQDGTDTALGNLTLGLEYILSAARRGANVKAWSIGGSLSAPTASDSGGGFATSAIHGFFRAPYPGRYLPNTTAIRIHGQFRLDAQKIFFQAQGGINHLIIDGGDDDMLLRFGLGLGIAPARAVTLIAELTTLSDIVDDADGDNFVHSLDLGARFRAGAGTQIGVRLYLPLDDVFRDSDVMGLAVDVRYRF